MQDLHNYRLAFVAKLKEQGIEATATRRIHQFKYQDNKKQGVLHKNERTGAELGDKKPTVSQLKKIKAAHSEVAKQYQAYADSLPSDQMELKAEIKRMIESRAVKDKGRGR